MRRAAYVLLSPIAALLLAGCAANAVRLEAAGAVQARSRAAVAATTTYFDAIEQRRRAAAAVLVASDPGCLPATPLRIQVPVAPGAPPPRRCAWPTGRPRPATPRSRSISAAARAPCWNRVSR